MPALQATAARNTEDLVAAELKRLGFSGVRYAPGAVRFVVEGGGELAGAMKAVLHLRAALRVLWPLADFACAGADPGDALYQGARAIEWETYVTPKHTFAVSVTARAPANTAFLALRVKDAIVDRLRDRSGSRPDVDKSDPDVRVYAHVAEGRATVGLDVADSLHARGYRAASEHAAPLRETLAAAVLLASGWRADVPLLDPMCGSGTIAIEAAMIACRIPPGLASRFPFTRWPIFDSVAASTWRDLLSEAAATILPRSPVPIFASDRDEGALASARACVAAAHPSVAASIDLRLADAREIAPLDPPGVIVSNPPYGERIGPDPSGLAAFYRALGARLRTLHGHTAFLLLPPSALRVLGMRPTWERKLKNGPLDVSLARFELGKRRA